MTRRFRRDHRSSRSILSCRPRCPLEAAASLPNVFQTDVGAAPSAPSVEVLLVGPRLLPPLVVVALPDGSSGVTVEVVGPGQEGPAERLQSRRHVFCAGTLARGGCAAGEK
jgi:hypothetical protein